MPWHNRLPHAYFKTIEQTLCQSNIPVFSLSKSLCESYCVAKSHRLPFQNSTSFINKTLDLICLDLWGPSPISWVSRFKYYVFYSKYCWIYFLKYKFEGSNCFIKFRHVVENFFGSSIKMFRSNWGGEFQPLASYLTENGIQHRVSC